MKLTVNGQAREIEAADVAALFAQAAEETGSTDPQGVAIALNGRVVRRRDWDTTPISEGDRIEIIRAMQGG
ncbi:sulfur carrier protein ThiS [Methylobacterium sp. E-041]|uniref:sulfur carrier protein ThiS n=1 Tax=Methylobacterium sp. E-041 TaxID=2836573 RepID=UPI001FB9C538|nr:sulfur carrier protein ThiS [Methylobacterium sp. E-041]MCJ2107959.1 sulfur carrier protein ThiS [Methylobacterium sp. E-041]